VEIANCKKLRELDLKNTYVITLPRELANLACLLNLNLDGCPMKESLNNSYARGMTQIHTDLRRKEDRKIYKEQLFNQLTEWVYPSEPKENVFEQIEVLFNCLKDCSTEMLKKLLRNCQRMFPVKFHQIDPLVIREKLFKLQDEGVAREDIAQLQLRIKSHFLDEPLEVVVKLATDIYCNVHSQKTIDDFFRYKSSIFKGPMADLTASQMEQNLADYKEFKRVERLETIAFLKNQIDTLYSDEKIKEEKLIEFTNGLVNSLKRTSFIKLFAETLANYMPKYNELKHFNPVAVSQKFLTANGLQLSS
jgi:Leucine-rich repeat (LRR) protein